MLPPIVVVDLSLLVKIRIDDAGSQESIQFEKQWHPPLKPMHYAQGGLASMLM
jgi:hypothetical protein